MFLKQIAVYFGCKGKISEFDFLSVLETANILTKGEWEKVT